MAETYLYAVHPKHLIKGIEGLPALRSPKSLYLTKEQVVACLKFGSVYRRFANEGKNEKVTLLNVDRFHNAKYMSEEEYSKFEDSKVENSRGSVINHKSAKKEPEIKETPTDVEQTEKEVELVSDTTVDVPDQELVEVSNEEKTEKTEVEYKSEESTEAEQNHNNYRQKNKNHNK